MFENCGSCFAAEQFVDIRLGAKYLLTLTSYYYEREWKFMAMITLQNSRNAEVTVLTNNFIDNYMPGANGEFVKVYIYLLRLLSDTSVPFSLEQMADHFFCTERDIIRALKYWEKEKLLTLTYRNNEDIADIILNVPPVKSAASDTPVSAAPVTKTETQTSSAPAQPVKQTTRSATALSPDRVKELKQNDEIVQLLYIAEQYLGKTLTPTEMKKILFFYDELKFSPDLIEYLIEYSVSRGHKSMRYIETVALAWADEGITTVTMAKEANSRYAKEYFTIFKSMGISGRNPVDTEISLMNTWLNDYGFTMDIIQEAVQFSLPDSQVSSMQIKSFPDGKIKMSVHLQMSGSSMLSISDRSWKRIPSEKQLPNRLHQTGLTISISDSTTLTNMKRNY
jgi:DnaD/phage-associated family protein